MKILLRQLRTTRKLSQNKLAQLMGMSLQNIQRIEYGDAKSIPLETLDKLCQILDCQPGDLLIRIPDGETDTPPSVSSHKVQRIKSEIPPGDNNPSPESLAFQSRFQSLPKIPESA